MHRPDRSSIWTFSLKCSDIHSQLLIVWPTGEKIDFPLGAASSESASVVEGLIDVVGLAFILVEGLVAKRCNR